MCLRRLLMAILVATTASTQVEAKGCWVVKLPRGHVVLYAKASASSPVVAQLQDPQLIVLDESDEASEWTHVTIEGQESLTGWVRGTRFHSNSCG
jgi:hypothetical protein